MHTARKLIFSLLAAAMIFWAPTAEAQNRTRFAGRYNALDYAYGLVGGAPSLSVAVGNTATGTATITIVTPCIALGDGTPLCPLSTTAPILVGVGATQDSITPTALSNCSYQSAGYGACAITGSFTFTHGTGEIVTTGSYGVQEAINAALASSGGIVAVDSKWALTGGTTAKITGATAYSNVFIEDTRTGDQWWSMQPTTLTSLAAPSTLTNTTVTFSATPAGTWTNAAQFLCVTYVDALGGEGPCSATYNTTPSASTSLTITSPAASTGAVGWRAYGGASYNAAYLLPVTTASCTLTTLESVMPACAIGSNGLWTAIFVNTTTLRPNAQSPTVNLQLPFPQGHTTFAYAPSGSLPVAFQTNYGPFPAFGSLTAGQVAVLGSVNLPTGYLNANIGRTVQIRGKITTGSVNTATLPTLNVALGWVGGTTAGAPVNLCSFEGVAAGATKVYNGQFECTLTTNAIGATAVGTIQPAGFLMLQAQDISANGLGPYIDQNTAAVATLGLFAQNTVYVTYTSTTNTTAAPQLLDLHVITLQ